MITYYFKIQLIFFTFTYKTSLTVVQASPLQGNELISISPTEFTLSYKKKKKGQQESCSNSFSCCKLLLLNFASTEGGWHEKYNCLLSAASVLTALCFYQLYTDFAILLNFQTSKIHTAVFRIWFKTLGRRGGEEGTANQAYVKNASLPLADRLLTIWKIGVWFLLFFVSVSPSLPLRSST